MSGKILEKLAGYKKDFDMDRVGRALSFFEGKEPFLAVDLIDTVLPLKPDEDTIIAVLMHKFYLRDGKIDGGEIKKLFGQEVYNILLSVKRLEVLNYTKNDREAQLEVLRKMFLAMAKDLRVIFVSLSCRLIKMEHLEDIVSSSEERSFFAKETLDLYVPVAARLGIYRMKSQLEDLAFRYSNPEDYKNILEQLNSLRKSCDISIAFIKKQLDKFLKLQGVEAEVSGRIKNVYSIYRKLKRKGFDAVSDLYDIFAMRIILPAKIDDGGNGITDQLYGVLGLIHGEWKPISKRFKDYLAVPRSNGYRSLHTVVLGLAPKDHDQPVEIQIRDAAMHEEAEYGVASHWIYTDSDGKSQDVRSRAEWIRGLGEIRSDFDIGRDGGKEVEIDIFGDRIFVLTPRGNVKDLPRGSVPIDFAYSVHTDIGNRCVMVRVNGKVVPLDHELNNGDVVEIVTRRDAVPKLRWLSIVKTNFARNRIKTWFSTLNRENNIREGRLLLNNQLVRIGKPSLDQNYSVLKNYCGEKLTLSKRESLVSELGRGSKLASDIIRKIYPYREAVVDGVVGMKVMKERKQVSLKDAYVPEDNVLVGGEHVLPVKIASCCKPGRNDSIIGYVTRGNRVTIHDSRCSLLDSLDDDRIVFAEWKDKSEGRGPKYLVSIKISALGRVGLMRDVTSVISNLGVNIRDVAVKKTKNGLSEEYYLLELDDPDQFDRVVDKLENIKDVFKVVRDDKFKSKIFA